MQYLVEALRALGNSERLRLFSLLEWQGAELCVCKLVEDLDLLQRPASKHLRILRRIGVIESIQVERWYNWSAAGARTF